MNKALNAPLCAPQLLKKTFEVQSAGSYHETHHKTLNMAGLETDKVN